MLKWAIIGLLVLAAVIVAAVLIARATGRSLGTAARNSFDAVFRPDSAGRYPSDPGWVDEDA